MGGNRECPCWRDLASYIDLILVDGCRKPGLIDTPFLDMEMIKVDRIFGVGIHYIIISLIDGYVASRQ